MSDVELDFNQYLAARREANNEPLPVQVGDRVLQFRPVRRSGILFALADGDDFAIAGMVAAFYKDSLSPEDFAYLSDLGDRAAETGFDQDAFHALYNQVTAKETGRPTKPSESSASSQPDAG